MAKTNLHDPFLQLAVCRCCLEPDKEVRLTKRSVLGLPWLFYRNNESPGDYIEDSVLMCQYCSVRFSRCLEFAKSVTRCQDILADYLKIKSYEKMESAFPPSFKHKPHHLTTHCTGQIDIPSGNLDTSEGYVFFIEYPKLEVLKNENSDCEPEEAKTEFTHAIDDGVKVEFDFEHQNDDNDKNKADLVKCKSKKKREKTNKAMTANGLLETDYTEDEKFEKRVPILNVCKKSFQSEKKRKSKEPEKKRITGEEMEYKMAAMKFKIVYLDTAQQLQEIETNKMSEKYLNAPHKCNVCGTGFVLGDSYDNHMYKHSEARGAHRCDICQLRFGRAPLLQCHRRDHTRRFLCTVCGAAVRNYTDCDRHYARCAGYRGPVACDTCGKYLKDTYSLNKHILLIHRSVRKFTCDYCNKDFRQKISLQNHIRRHTGERPYACARCSQTFASHYCLKQHALVHAPRGAHYCVECDRRYRSLSSLRQHLARSPRHRDTRPEFKHGCGRCDRRYYSRRELQVHVAATHTAPADRRPLQCPQCPKAYLRENVLRRHVLSVHRDVKRPRAHVCQLCGKAFTERFRLASHARTHTGERPFPCAQCPAVFAHRSAVSAHVKAKHPPAES